MTMHISREQARRFLVNYHFRQSNITGVFKHLGTVQYDPLNQVGRNPDLVLQARVPGYRVDDWQHAAYNERIIYDSWDKQTCLVPVGDWPQRAILREKFRSYHDRGLLQATLAAADAILAAIDERGPLSSLEFEGRSRTRDHNSWYNPTQTNRLLRTMWTHGVLATHHRQGGRHYYDRSERVIPAEHYQAPPLLDVEAYHRWIVMRRFQAVGLLRPNAEQAIWSACGDGPTRKEAIAQLAVSGALTPVTVGEKSWLYYIPTAALALLDAPPPEPRMLFMGPLDNLLWDRKAIQQIFDFDYTWEVYKPPAQRKWGYYVLPVFYGERFVARIDSRLEKGVWTIARWWWEPDVIVDAELIDALRLAVVQFVQYLQASDVRVEDAVDPATRGAFLSATP